MAKPKAKSLADDVGELMVAYSPKTWWDRLPDDAQRELLAVRERFQSGGYQGARTALARVLHDRCSQRGWKTCDPKRLGEWLAKTT